VDIEVDVYSRTRMSIKAHPEKTKWGQGMRGAGEREGGRGARGVQGRERGAGERKGGRGERGGQGRERGAGERDGGRGERGGQGREKVPGAGGLGVNVLFLFRSGFLCGRPRRE
jgi:hypothetical protein